MTEQLRADLALLELAYEDAIDAPRQQPGQVALAQAERQPGMSSPLLTRQSKA